MNGYLSTKELLTDGWTNRGIKRAVASGELRRLRRGIYSDADTTHREQVAAALAAVDDQAVVSHTSAAWLHGLPVRAGALNSVTLTRARDNGGYAGDDIHMFTCRFTDGEVTRVAGLPATTLGRTILDVGRHEPLGWAVATGDAAMRLGLTGEALDAALASARRRPFVGRARRAIGLLNPLAESAGESISRITMMLAGLPEPVLQPRIVLPSGEVVYPDFGWLDRGVVGEFDGLVKYGRLVPQGEVPADVLVREKIREDGLRSLGLTVARWVWATACDRVALGNTVRRAFELASR